MTTRVSEMLKQQPVWREPVQCSRWRSSGARIRPATLAALPTGIVVCYIWQPVDATRRRVGPGPGPRPGRPGLAFRLFRRVSGQWLGSGRPHARRAVAVPAAGLLTRPLSRERPGAPTRNAPFPRSSHAPQVLQRYALIARGALRDSSGLFLAAPLRNALGVLGAPVWQEVAAGRGRGRRGREGQFEHRRSLLLPLLLFMCLRQGPFPVPFSTGTKNKLSLAKLAV